MRVLTKGNGLFRTQFPGILPDSSKLVAIKKFPEPKRMKDIHSFIGLAGLQEVYWKLLKNSQATY